VLFGERHTPWVLFSMLGMFIAIWLNSSTNIDIDGQSK